MADVKTNEAKQEVKKQEEKKPSAFKGVDTLFDSAAPKKEDTPAKDAAAVKTLSETPAFEIAALPVEVQDLVLDWMAYQDRAPTVAQAISVRQHQAELMKGAKNKGDDYMPKIYPISDLRNNLAEITKLVHETQEPVFITKKGLGDMVVMSMKQWWAMCNATS